MYCKVFRLNCIQLSRHWFQHARMGSVNLSSCGNYHQYPGKNGHGAQQQRPRLLYKSLENVVHQHHYHSNGYNDSKDYRLGIGIISVVLGSAVWSIGTALCENKEEKESKSKGNLPTLLANEKCSEDVVGYEPMEKISHNVERKYDSERRNNYLELNEKPLNFQDVVKKSRQLLRRRMKEAGAPGLVVAVSMDGKTVWAEGFGFADIENNVRCSSNTVMRIASISKSITMTAVAKLWEDGKLDLDAPIQKYMPYFPVKSFEGEEVTITTRHLLSHQSGIRHYKLKDPKKQNDSKKKNKKDDKDEKTNDKKVESDNTLSTTGEEKNNKDGGVILPETETKATQVPEEKTQEKEKTDTSKKSQSVSVTPEKKKEALQKLLQGKANKKKKKEEEDEFDVKEYYIKEKFDTIEDTVKLFQDDDLFFKPGNSFLYTTHGWTVVSGVVEGAAEKPFTQVITQLFHDLGLDNTYLDKHSPIIYNRAKYYIRDKHWRLQNAPYVDNSYKWAGGGFLSTVHDLTKFGNAMLYASQVDSTLGSKGSTPLPGFLKPSTMHDLWTPVNDTNMVWDRDGGYGLGWGTVLEKQTYGFCRKTRQYASHTGGAVGASSVLLILPKQKKDGIMEVTLPNGIVVSLITNMQGVGLNKVALKIAKLFESIEEN